jgi:hypothetical protein
MYGNDGGKKGAYFSIGFGFFVESQYQFFNIGAVLDVGIHGGKRRSKMAKYYQCHD